MGFVQGLEVFAGEFQEDVTRAAPWGISAGQKRKMSMDAAALISAIVAMSGAVAILWRRVEKMISRVEQELKDTRRELKDCQDDRLNLWKMVRSIYSGKMSETQRIVLEGEP